MPTQLVLNIEDPETGHSMVVEVQEAFSRVLDLLMPLEPPASQLATRRNFTLTQADGKQIFVLPQAVAVIMET